MLPALMDADNLVEAGNALFKAGDLEGAMAQYRAALRAEASYGRAHYNLAVALQRLGRLSESEDHYRRVAADAPQFMLARSNLSILELFRHDFASGWSDYEARIPSGGIGAKSFSLPRLSPENVTSADRIAIWKEQGIGDQILFSTLLPELLRRGLRIVVETDPRLMPAFRRRLPPVEFVSELTSEVVATCSHHSPLGSLARIFRTSEESFAAQPQFILAPDVERAAAMDAVLPKGLRIGISWKTFQPPNREHVAAPRSVPLECFARLDRKDVSLVDLQYGNVDADRRAFDERHPGLRADPGIDRFNDLEGLLATIAACDLIITPSNVTAHLAGALGKPTWLIYLAGKAPFHYWVPAPDGRCLWYPSVTIVSDRSWTSWDQAFEAIATRLTSLPTKASGGNTFDAKLARRAMDEQRRTLRANPADGEAARRMLLLASGLAEAGDYENALECSFIVLDADSQNPFAHYQAGLSSHNLGRLQAAISHYKEAMSLKPDLFEAAINAANVLGEMGDWGGAVEMNTRALASTDAGLRARGAFGLAHLSLRSHNFEQAWAGYEARLEMDSAASGKQSRGLPRLQASDIAAGVRVAVWSEQGIGDQVLFSTLLPDLVASGVSPLVEVDSRLEDAFRRSVPGACFESTRKFETLFRDCDFEIPLGSLAGLFRIDAESFRRQPRALLRADHDLSQRMRALLGQGPKIGISWRSIQPAATRYLEGGKSSRLERFAAFEDSGATLIDLQYGDVDAERREFDARHPRLRREIPGLDQTLDLEGLLAAIEACDLVITTSNATAHFAGALGKRTWLLFRAANPPFHYWVPDVDGRSLWYPSVEIVTDASWTDWPAVFSAVSRRYRDENQ